ncbi:hypothetical protein Tco_0256710 [Tanacetum coccineum]
MSLILRLEMQVIRKNGKGKQDDKAKQIASIKLTKPKPNLVYRVVKKHANASGETSGDKQPTSNVSPIQQNSNASDSRSGRYTWNQKPNDDDGILKKIDRIMANMEFLASFVGASVLFQPYRISDHAPAVLRVPMLLVTKPRPFKFCNIVVHNVWFKEMVANGWQNSVSGFWMFKVVKRLKFLKKPLRKLLYDHGNIYENVKKLRHELDEAQKALDSDPNNIELREEEAAYLKAFNDALLMEERFLMQKAKVEWLKLGDANTAYFHKVMKSQASRNRIDSVTTSNGEIREAIFCMGDNKAPSPDGYSAAFFKEAWDIIKVDVTKAIMEFFINGVLLKELNHTIIALIPKSLNSLVSLNHSAFVPGRRIFDNILLTQELMHNYHLDRSTPRFTSMSFSLSINGSLHGYFKGKRGLRQGDPMSPYLFTLVIEVLTLMLHRRARASDFTYHRYCSKFNIINLCFADDLFLFAHGDVDSARVIMHTLEEFKTASGLTPSLPKSMAYFCNVLNHVKLDILHILPFEEGKLPIKYLGVPLVASRLLYQDCVELMEKVKRRISDWKNKSLSLAGRVQLIRSILGEMRRGKAKVVWEDVCIPKREGGLGIRRLEGFNKALISTHIWSLLLRKESLWVKWIHTYMLNGRTFWEIPFRGKMSWGWRKILQVRNLVQPFIWFRVGDGATISGWFDNWCALSPLASFISNRDIYRAGLGLSAKVGEIIEEGTWDSLVWRHITHGDVDFSVAKAWDCIRPRAKEVDWFHVVWFSHQIPRHAIHLWLVMKRKLKTQDMPRQCDVCNHMKSYTGISNIPSDLSSIVDFLIPLARMRSARTTYVQVQEDEECADDYSSLEAAYLAYSFFSSLMRAFMNIQGSLFYVVRGLEAGWLMECPPRTVLFFPSPRFFPCGFSWEGFLRRQYRLAVYTPMLLQRDDFDALCTFKWFFPIVCLLAYFVC